MSILRSDALSSNDGLEPLVLETLGRSIDETWIQRGKMKIILREDKSGGKIMGVHRKGNRKGNETTGIFSAMCPESRLAISHQLLVDVDDLRRGKAVEPG